MAWNTEAYRKYRASEKCKKTTEAYRTGEGYLLSMEKYAKSEKGKSARKKYRDLYYKTEKGRKSSMWHAARRRAEKKGLAFEITKDDITFPEACPLLGIPLNLTDFGVRYDSPSIDRIDSSKGYTKDNIWVISTRANILKNNATIIELETLLTNWKAQCGYIYA